MPLVLQCILLYHGTKYSLDKGVKVNIIDGNYKDYDGIVMLDERPIKKDDEGRSEIDLSKMNESNNSIIVKLTTDEKGEIVKTEDGQDIIRIIEAKFIKHAEDPKVESKKSSPDVFKFNRTLEEVGWDPKEQLGQNMVESIDNSKLQANTFPHHLKSPKGEI